MTVVLDVHKFISILQIRIDSFDKRERSAYDEVNRNCPYDKIFHSKLLAQYPPGKVILERVYFSQVLQMSTTSVSF